MSKSIKKTVTILSFLLAGFILIIAGIPVLLQSDKIQNFIAQTVVKELSESLNTEISIGKVKYKLLNSIEINHILIKDRQADTLAFIHKAKLDFRFREFLKGKYVFTSVDVEKFQGFMVVDSAGIPNFQFIIDALNKPAKRTAKSAFFEIKNIDIRKSSVDYSDMRFNPKVPSGVMNTARLKIRDINTKIDLNILTPDTLNAEIKKLSFSEISGFSVKNITAAITGNGKKFDIPQIRIKLPASEMLFSDVKLLEDTIFGADTTYTKLNWEAPLKYSKIYFSDISALSPDFGNIVGHASVTGDFSGKFSSIRLKNLEIKYGKSFLLQSDIDLNGLNNIEDAFVYAVIKDMKVEKNAIQDFVSDITRKPFILPDELNRLGIISYNGNITGFFSNLVAFGKFNTNLGAISTDILLKFDKSMKNLDYNGNIGTRAFDLGKLLNNNTFGRTSFSLNTVGTKPEKAPFRGTVKALVPEFEFNRYAYRDVKFDGSYDGTGFNGNVLIEDTNIGANFNGIIDLTGTLPVFDFNLKVKEANLYALNLIKNYAGAFISFNGETNMTGNNPDNMNGIIRFDSITLINSNKTLNVSEILFTSTTSASTTDFTISSDYMNGAVSGNFRYSTLPATINNIIQHYLPSLSAWENSTASNTGNNLINIDLDLTNTNEISEILELPYKIDGKSKIRGKIDERFNQIEIEANIPGLKTGKQQLENLTLRIDREPRSLKVVSRAQLIDKTGPVQLFLTGSAANDSLTAQLGWQNSQQITNAGEINTCTKFRKDNGKTAARMQILPTEVIINDTVWDIRSSSIDFNPDSTIVVHNFRFENSSQYIYIDGIASPEPADSVTISMNDLDLGFVTGLLQIKNINFGGYVTGKANIYSLLKQAFFDANLSVEDFKINDVTLANADIGAKWDSEKEQILLQGFFTHSNGNPAAIAGGVFVPKNDSLDINIDAKSLDVNFLQPYFEGLVSNFRGKGSGNLRLYGPTAFLLFDGDLFLNDAQFKLDVTQTTYHFSDSVKLRPESIIINNISLYDEENNRAIVNGLVSHNGAFKNLSYGLTVRARNFTALNTTARDNEFFYGKAFVTGSVEIDGDESETNININAVTQPRTKCYFQMDGEATATEKSLFNFLKPDSENSNEAQNGQITVENPEVNVNVDMLIDVTPDAEMEMIIDNQAGDMITGKGYGSLRVQFDTYSDVKLYGTYTLEQGYYLFTLQTLIRKEFKIDRGSTISWAGSPYNAQVNIRALYGLTASLSDLMDKAELESSTTRSSVPVNCVLKLTDNLMTPNIIFDIDLPSSDESLKQKVRNIINTEEMMNRQIVYLLLLNKFYTPDYMRTDPILGVNEGLSFATSTLSAHINNWIKQSFNSSNLSVGFDWQKSEAVNDEWKAQVLYQPNKRLIVNGNLGYRNENANASTNNNKFIGDFDVEWLLTESGIIRFKAYSHTIDRAQLREAKTTQGVGIIYREDFNNWTDMLNYYWSKVTGIVKPKKTEN